MLKILLTAAIPLQSFLDKTSPTHGFINQQALAILTADGRRREAFWLSHYVDEFNRGCDWADTGWKNVGHMYDPETGIGLRGWQSAPEILRDYWNMAVQYFAQTDLPHAFFYLGAAAHVVQDLCVPHHAAARLFAGHRQFEAYARRYRHRYAVHSQGLYNLARTPEGWLIQNAEYTRRHYSHCLTRSPELKSTHLAVSDLLPRAQRTTAGFVAYFLKEVA